MKETIHFMERLIAAEGYPSIDDVNHLLAKFIEIGDSEKVIKFHAVIENAGITPNKQTYRLLAQACDALNETDLVAHFQKLEKSAF